MWIRLVIGTDWSQAGLSMICPTPHCLVPPSHSSWTQIYIVMLTLHVAPEPIVPIPFTIWVCWAPCVSSALCTIRSARLSRSCVCFARLPVLSSLTSFLTFPINKPIYFLINQGHIYQNVLVHSRNLICLVHHATVFTWFLLFLLVFLVAKELTKTVKYISIWWVWSAPTLYFHKLCSFEYLILQNMRFSGMCILTYSRDTCNGNAGHGNWEKEKIR